MGQAEEAFDTTARPWGWFDNWVKRLTAIVALLAGVFGLVKVFDGREASKTPNNLNLITDYTVIFNQYQQATGQPLTDVATKDLIRSAVSLAKAGQYDASRERFKELASSVPVPAVFTNLGALDFEKGDKEGAKQALQQAVAKQPDYKPALENLQKLATPEPPRLVRVSRQESEPNNDFDHANVISVGNRIAASITDGSDTDFFQFKTPSGPRDYYQVTVENNSLTLHPGITLYDDNRQKLQECSSGEPVAHLDCAFSALPELTYFVQVWGKQVCCYSPTIGAYQLGVVPQKRYDAFEPNDDFPQAKPIPVGSTIEADIMDGSDTDFYLVKTVASGGQLTARLENASTTLHPGITLYDGNRQKLQECSSGEPVAHLDCAFAALPHSMYYVQVWGKQVCCYTPTAGKYRLTVK